MSTNRSLATCFRVRTPGGSRSAVSKPSRNGHSLPPALHITIRSSLGSLTLTESSLILGTPTNRVALWQSKTEGTSISTVSSRYSKLQIRIYLIQGVTTEIGSAIWQTPVPTMRTSSFSRLAVSLQAAGSTCARTSSRSS